MTRRMLVFSVVARWEVAEVVSAMYSFFIEGREGSSASDQQLIHDMTKTLSGEYDHVNRKRRRSAQARPQRAVEATDVSAGELGHRVLTAVVDRLEQVDALAAVSDEIGGPGHD